MTTYRLDPTTCTNYDGSTDYGAAAWSDGSDATYATIGYSADPDSVGNIPAYTGGPISSMSFHFRASATGDADGLVIFQLDRNHTGSRTMWSHGGSDAGRESIANAGHPLPDPKMDWLIPNDGVIRDYSVVVDDDMLINSGWDTIAAGGLGPDQVGGDLALSTCRLYLWADSHPVVFDTTLIHIYEAWIEVETIDLPCDTPEPLGLAGARILSISDVPTGQYVDGVLCTRTGPGGLLYPDSWFNFTVDPGTSYDVKVTHDPTSPHDAGGREVQVLALRPGTEQADADAANAIGINAGGAAVLYDTGLGFPGSDVQTFTIGPGLDRGHPLDDSLPGWSDPTLGVTAGYTRLWFETDWQGAVSDITVTRRCTPPVERTYPRSDDLGMSPSPRNYPPPPGAIRNYPQQP